MRGEGGGSASTTSPARPSLSTRRLRAEGARAARGAKPSGRSPSEQGRVVGLLPTAIPASPSQPFLDREEYGKKVSQLGGLGVRKGAEIPRDKGVSGVGALLLLLLLFLLFGDSLVGTGVLKAVWT